MAPYVRVVQLWCEYDIGQEGIVFGSAERAEEWFNEVVDFSEFEEDLQSYKDFDEAGLAGLEELRYVQ